MKVVVSGASGLVGSALMSRLSGAGHQTERLVRTAGGDGIHWDPVAGQMDRSALENWDAVVHLAGENIANGRWTAKKKERIGQSRIAGTSLLCQTLAGLARPPRVLVSASAIGYYGDRGDEVLSEESPPGTGFLSDVCQQWEQATEPAGAKGIRVARLRFGVILSPAGGALKSMLPPFRLGLGGRLGNGRQFMSWLALDDAVNIIEHTLSSSGLRGPVNAVSPQPVTNSEFTRVLGSVLSRPTIFPVPSLGVRILFGELADALLLASTRVIPARLQQAGFRFQYPELEAGLHHLLGR